MADGYDLGAALTHIDPAQLNYQDWCAVGMALKQEGHTAAEWDMWSRRDPGRYKPGECLRKWESFRGSAAPVTGGTIVRMARAQGWQPAARARDTYAGARGGAAAGGVPKDGAWDPAGELIAYLETLFESSDNVGYVTESWQDGSGRYLPTRGSWDRTAGELIAALHGCGGDIGAVLGDHRREAGAWIRFNPLDGCGCKNENVTDYRYALVESDKMDIERQHAIIRALELPVACLVHSGKRSLHAIVRIEAATYEEYRRRVEYLYDVLKKNGMAVDTQNKNPSRLSRMPGVLRGEARQYLVGRNMGKGSFREWQAWVESAQDDLPEPESLAAVWEGMPDLAPPLIGGVLRQGHKMLIAGPSKAGKTFALLELCCAIAEGRTWLGWPCAQGRVLYVNLELDRASCLHRFRDIYAALGWAPAHLGNIDVWNLRGRSVPMDKLAPRLIRRAAAKGYIAIVLDPIYKVITGDENSADQMAHFCNQFDRVCTELGAAVIYCHHHSKGAQGQKRAMDRASGSGVFARDPDTLLDFIELECPAWLAAQEESRAACRLYAAQLGREDVPEADERDLHAACTQALSAEAFGALQREVEAARRAVRGRTAWRVDGTLREFPKFTPVNVWFAHPVHVPDGTGLLRDADADGEAPPWQRAAERRKQSAKRERTSKAQAFEDAVGQCGDGAPPTKQALAAYLGITERSVGDRMRAHGGFMLDRNTGRVVRRE